MKAVLFKDKQKISYQEVKDPKIRDNEVLIKVKYCGLCGTDIALYFGNMPYISSGEQKYPFIPGHEWSGEVLQIGKNVKNINIGDRVTGDVSIGCGKCRDCQEGRYNLCNDRYEVGNYRNKDGGMAQFIVMPERHTYKFSENIDYIGGAIIEPLATALYGLSRRKLDYAENILITGTGLIGIMAAQVAQINSSSSVIVTGRTEEKLERAKKCGIKNIINIKENDLKGYLSDMGLLEKITFCIECSGNINALKQCIKFVKPGGHISIIGFYENDTEVINFDDITIKDIEVHGILGSPNFFIPSINLLEKGLIKYEPLISKVFELSEVETAIKYLLDKKNKAIKVMLKVS